MKKSSAIHFLVFLATVLIAITLPFYLLKYSFNWQDLAKVTQNLPLINTAVEKIEPFISLPPPLRAEKETPDSFLTVQGVFVWTNNARRNNDAPPLVLNDEISQAARAKVGDMFNNQYFEHVSPSGLGVDHWVEQTTYRYIALGENLALGNFTDDQELVLAWMDSPGHRENILNESFEEIGIAVKKGTYEGKQTWLAVQIFAKPLSSCPAIDENLSLEIENNQKQLSAWSNQLENLNARLKSERPRGRASQAEIDAYNALVEQYNQLADDYNTLLEQTKVMVDQYNQQIAAFNACAGGS
ncbi:MAG: hypothetical protein A2731_04035 [Candidatus Buchananbacteria bacterium RIFCSPHIGHO2_01_FULL_39_8]|uniref:SCP domain-containing protein n=1 Tax=Candidatus Buchananbacteria bacterium RIFCSPHIGHO2_01_FULL_39_8 TaxID=1797533 RepID=A0A1G1XZV3_9BACT|nr:hypothetical protein [uncultured bacterium]OGY45126.1 MAG: hypothetical protein A2731_04035 [Candidatus Buchananbacteria bacterium RIFCSPHIGHO2_01_FULL_39_8]